MNQGGPGSSERSETSRAAFDHKLMLPNGQVPRRCNDLCVQVAVAAETRPQSWQGLTM
jgi:hypothetical protein